MEFNVSARNPNFALKERLTAAAAEANKLFDDLPPNVDEQTLRNAVREYVRIRYLLEPQDLAESEYFQQLGETSLARGLGMPVETVRKTEFDSKCENTSSTQAKKILLVIALGKRLSISFKPDTTADITTISELCDETYRLLAERAETPKGKARE